MSTQGQVVNFSERLWNNKTLYSVCVDIDGSGEQWFGLGEVRPVANKGDVVSFDVEKRGKYNNVKGGKMTVDVKASPAPASNGKGSQWQQKEGYWQEKAERDVVNDARYNLRAATMMSKDIVLAMYAVGDIKFPAKSNPLEVLTNTIDMVAVDYYARWMAHMPDELEPEPGPADSDDDIPSEEAF